MKIINLALEHCVVLLEASLSVYPQMIAQERGIFELLLATTTNYATAKDYLLCYMTSGDGPSCKYTCFSDSWL
jgi:hypothetical protein